MDTHKLTYDIKEIEELCRLYQDGEFSLKEEKYLETVLSNLYVGGSEVIDETLFLMGISKTVSKSAAMSESSVADAKRPRHKRRNPFGRLIKIGSAAAVVAAVLAVGWHFYRQDNSAGNEVYEVYAFGEKVTDREKSREMALESYNRSMELLARMKQLEEEKMSAAEKVRQIQTM